MHDAGPEDTGSAVQQVYHGCSVLPLSGNRRASSGVSRCTNSMLRKVQAYIPHANQVIVQKMSTASLYAML